MAIQTTANIVAGELAHYIKEMSPYYLDVASRQNDLKGKLAVDYLVPSALVVNSPLVIALTCYVSYNTVHSPYNYTFLYCRYAIPRTELTWKHRSATCLTLAYQMVRNLDTAIKRRDQAMLEELKGQQGMNESVGGYGFRIVV